MECTPPDLGLSKKRRMSDNLAAPGPESQRRRITRACDACKQRKSRCSGTIPCGRCARLSLECQYSVPYGRGLPPSPLPAPVAPDYQHINPGRAQSNVRETVTSPKELESVRRGLEEHIRVTQSQRPSSCNSPQRGGTDLDGHYIGPSSGITFLNRAWRRLNHEHIISTPVEAEQDVVQQTPIFTFRESPFQAPKGVTLNLPTQTRGSQMVARYFHHAVVTYRFLHRETVDSWFTEIYEQNVVPYSNVPESTARKAAVIFMTWAIVLLNEEREVADSDEENCGTSESWFAAADHMLSIECGPCRLETLQARMIQCLYLYESARANQCWYVFGITCHLLMAMGLHRRRSGKLDQRHVSYIEEECQKRLFWSAYTLDRYLNMMLGRPRTFHDDEVDQDFPDEINDQDMTIEGPDVKESDVDCSYTASILQFKLGRLIGEISRDVYTIRPVTEGVRLKAAERLALEIDSWKSNLPPIFGNIRSSSLKNPFQRQSNVLQIAYAHLVVYANRSFLLNALTNRKTEPAINEEIIHSSVEKCVEAARLIIKVGLITSHREPLSTACWFQQYASFCAAMVIYIYTIQQYNTLRDAGALVPELSHSNRQLLDLAQDCQRRLTESCRKNSPSIRYGILLEELRQEICSQLVGSSRKKDRLGQLSGADSSVSHHDPQSQLDVPVLDITGNVSFGRESGFFPQSSLHQGWDMTDWAQLDTWAFANLPDIDLQWNS